MLAQHTLIRTVDRFVLCTWSLYYLTMYSTRTYHRKKMKKVSNIIEYCNRTFILYVNITTNCFMLHATWYILHITYQLFVVSNTTKNAFAFRSLMKFAKYNDPIIFPKQGNCMDWSSTKVRYCVQMLDTSIIYSQLILQYYLAIQQ